MTIKKKIKDLTPAEINLVCESHDECLKCPIFVANAINCCLRSTLHSFGGLILNEKLNTEVELELEHEIK